MEFFNIFQDVISKEKKRFNLDETKFISSTSALTSTLSENFETPYNRCAYMYRYATVTTQFVKECISKFLTDCAEVTDLLALWRSHSDLGLCSFSFGPGLDYLSFVLAISEFGETPDLFNSVNIISKTASWRNTVNYLSESLEVAKIISLLPKNVSFQNVKVFQSDIKKGFRMDMINYLRNSEVVLMVKTLNLSDQVSEDEAAYLLSNLDALISSLRPETVIFVIDSKPSVSLMLKALGKSLGLYLYGPVHVPYRHPVTYPEVFKEKFTVLPVQSARGTFFVWRKSAIPLVPDLPVLPECIQVMELEREMSARTTEFPVVGLLGGSPAEYQSYNISSSPSKLGDTRINSPLAQEGSSYSNPKSNLCTSTSSSHSDILDSMLTEILNAPSTVKPLTLKKKEDFESVHDSKERSNVRFSVAGSSNSDSVVRDKLDSPSDIEFQVSLPESWDFVRNSTEYLPPPSPWDSVSSHHSSSTPDRKNSEKQETIPNPIDKKHTNHLRPCLESKLTQTDPVAETKPSNHSDSIKLLTDRINKLVCSFEKELVQPKDPCRCYDCAQGHYGTSSMENCDNAHSKKDGKSLCKSDNLAQTSDADNSVGCDSFCSVKSCSKSVQGESQCCQRLLSSLNDESSSRQLYVNNPVNVTVPSIVIPLENLNMDVLTRILSDVKNNIKMG